MTATPAEVLRTLPPELGAGRIAEGRIVRGASGTRRWELELVPAPRLRLGMLDLEVTELVIRLRGHSDEERARFLARLEECCRRGGG